MAEIINSNVFDSTKKFVDFAGLDYFWDKAKAYIDGVDKNIKDRLDTAEGNITTLTGVVGDDNSGLVKAVAALRTEVDALGGVEGGIQGMIDSTIEGLKLPETYDAIGSAATALDDAKAYVDGKVDGKFDAVGSAATALDDAKAYVDGKVDGKFDTVGSAATALTDAKAYADGLAVNYDAAGSADAVEGKLDLHTTDTDIHITAQERTDWNAAKSAIDTFLKDAELDAEGVNVIDTLKELQTYVGSDPATALVTRVGTLETAVETINGTGEGSISKAADKALTDAKAYVDGKVDGKFDAVGSAATAESNAKAYADGLAVNYDAAGSAATAETNAKAYADGLAVNYDAAGSAAQALTDAKAYVDGKVDAKFDTLGSAAQALVDAKAYADSLAVNYDAAGSAAAAEANAKAYAASYTNALYSSITFANNSDIDTIFNVSAE